MIPRGNPVERIERVTSTPKGRKLPKVVLKGLWLHLSIDHTYVSAVPTIKTLLDCITTLEVVANGKDTIVRIPFYFLYYMNFLDNSYTPKQSLYVTASGSGTSTVSVFLPFGLLRAVAPQDTLLDARKLSSLILTATWGAATIGGTETITAGFLDIDTEEYSGVLVEKKFARHEFANIGHTLSATGEQNIDIPVGSNNQYRRFFLFCFDSAGALSDAEIDNLIVKSRSFTYFNRPSEYLKAMNMAEFSQTEVVGLYVLNLTGAEGLMSQRLDARKLGELILQVNALLSTGTCTLVLERAIYA